jgi:uncharacterized membrane protein YphA (DoxX/SURF4 family)
MTQTAAKRANRALWTAQILLALLFLMAGTTKLVMPIEKLQGPISLPEAFIRFIGICETLGALGLILPGLFRIRTGLTPLAAAGLVVIMTGATVLTVAGMGAGAAVLPLVVGVVAVAIAYTRWRVVPLVQRSRALSA